MVGLEVKKGTRMNANELADELEANINSGLRFTAATMLRQQQAEIEALKGGFFDWSGFKELTDEEIMDELVKVKHTWVATTSVWYEFEKEELKKAIRAILRKAQE